MRVILIDISGIIHTLWHVSGDEKDPNYVSNAAVARVRQIASGYDRTAICCDSRKCFRKEISPDYKANRDKKPEALFHQMDRAKRILEADGYAVLEADGFEADDVAATCVQALSANDEVEKLVVATYDKDLAQLVRATDEDGRIPPVFIYSLSSNEVRGWDDVIEKYGVAPSLLGDWLALVGDTSDNVKGAPGIGAAKATALLNTFRSLGGIFAAVAATGDATRWAANFSKEDPRARLIGGPAVYKTLTESGAQVAIARNLVELRTDAPVDCASVLVRRAQKPLATPEPDESDPFEPTDAGARASAAAQPEQSQQDTAKEIEVVTQQMVNPQTGEVTEVQTTVAVETAPPKPVAAAPAPNGNVKTELGKLLQQPVQWEKALEPVDSGGAIKLAGKLFNSRMFDGYGNEDAVLSTILMGRELGLGATASLRGIHNIKNKHGISADLMIAMCLRSGLCEYFEPVEQTAEKATWRCKRVGRDEKRETFEFGEARKAQLVKTDSNWDKYPKRMCSARAKAFLARDVFPDICFGLYTPDELSEGAAE